MTQAVKGKTRAEAERAVRAVPRARDRASSTPTPSERARSASLARVRRRVAFPMRVKCASLRLARAAARALNERGVDAATPVGRRERRATAAVRHRRRARRAPTLADGDAARRHARRTAQRSASSTMRGAIGAVERHLHARRVSAVRRRRCAPTARSSACGTARASTAAPAPCCRGPAERSAAACYEVRIESGRVLVGTRRGHAEAAALTASAARAAPTSRCSPANPELHYLDSAATSQKPRVVLDAMREYYEHDNANPHRGAYALSARATDRYHAARDARRAVHRRRRRGLPDLHARHDGVAQPRRHGVGTRERAARATRSSSPGSSTTRTSSRGSSSRSTRGARFRICALTTDGRVDLDALRVAASTPRTKVVAFTHVSNALGTINPVREIARDRARASARSSCATARRRAPHLPRRLRRARTSTSTRSAATRCCGPMGIGGAGRPPRAARGDAAVSDRRRHDRVRRRRAHDVERAAAQVRGGDAERRRTRSASPRRATTSTRSAWTPCARTSSALGAARDRAAGRDRRACASTARRRASAAAW